MILSSGLLIAGACMLLARFLSNISFLNFHTPWVAYDIAAIIITAVGVIRLALQLLLIFKARRLKPSA